MSRYWYPWRENCKHLHLLCQKLKAQKLETVGSGNDAVYSKWHKQCPTDAQNLKYPQLGAALSWSSVSLLFQPHSAYPVVNWLEVAFHSIVGILLYTEIMQTALPRGSSSQTWGGVEKSTPAVYQDSHMLPAARLSPGRSHCSFLLLPGYISLESKTFDFPYAFHLLVFVCICSC